MTGRTDDPAPPTVSALIVTFTQHRLLPRCLECLDRAALGISTEVVIVVNGVALTPEHRAAGDEGAVIVTAPINLGLAGGLQLARAHARGRYLALVQDDVEVGDDWLAPLVDALDAEPSAGAVGSRVMLMDGTLQHEGWLVGREGRHVLLGEADQPGSRRAVDGFGSSAALVRASAWDGVGGPDVELFPTGAVDQDLSFKLTEAGWTILVEPRSVARHHHSASTSARVKATAWRRNWHRVRRRHAALLAERAVDETDPDAVAAGLRQRSMEAATRRTVPVPQSTRRRDPSIGRLVRRARLTRLRLRAYVVATRVHTLSVRAARWRRARTRSRRASVRASRRTGTR